MKPLQRMAIETAAASSAGSYYVQVSVSVLSPSFKKPRSESGLLGAGFASIDNRHWRVDSTYSTKFSMPWPSSAAVATAVTGALGGRVACGLPALLSLLCCV